MGRMHSKGYAAQTAAQTAPPAAPPASLPRRRAGAARRCSTAQFFCQCSRPRRRPPALPHAAAPRATPWQPHAPPSKAPRSHPQICRAPLLGALRAALPLSAPLRAHRSAPAAAPLRKGISKSALPYRRTPPSWLKVTAEEIIDHITKLAKKGLTPSQIGVILRDSHGVAQVAHVTGSKILRILKKKGFAPEIPEDLYCLIKKAVAVRKHLDKFRQDKDAKFRLILIESRIHRVARYYKTVKALPPTWKYESATASTLVS